MSDQYVDLRPGDIIDEDTEFEVSPGEWQRLRDCTSVSARWMIGFKYSPRFFVPARRKTGGAGE